MTHHKCMTYRVSSKNPTTKGNLEGIDESLNYMLGPAMYFHSRTNATLCQT